MPALAALTAGVLAAATLTALPAQAAPSPDVVVSEVYGGGGNSGATLTHDFIELYNRGVEPVDVSGWSVQYASATGSSYAVTELSGTVGPGEHYLVQEAKGSGGTTPLPAPDATGTIAMSGTAGKVALVTTATALPCGSDCDAGSGVKDFVGYGSADDSETTPTGTLNNTTSASRDAAGTDTDDNSADFTVGDPDPENSGDDGDPEPPPTPTRIREIQGAAHRSPLLGERVDTVPGVVTQRTGNGFWMQDPAPDDDPATSEGIFVFTSSAPATGLTRGTAVTVAGAVGEFRPGGSTGANLSTTQIGSPTVMAGDTVALPDPTLVGPGGRTPPGQVIDDDANGDVETSGSFDAATDGIDFWESMEGMRIRVVEPEAVGPTNGFGELPLVTAGAGVRTARDGIVLRGDEDPSPEATDEPTDANPERIILDALSGTTMPDADVGDTLAADPTGVLDYSFGNFKLYVDEAPTVVEGGIEPEVTTVDGNGGTALTVATYNVENLDPGDPDAKFQALAEGIVDNLGSPDVVTLEEVQDNNGATDDGTVAADETLDELVAAIEAAGGPAYDWRQIDPQDKRDGGEPGGNIRVAFLFDPERPGLRFVDRGTGDATTATEVQGSGVDTRLSLSPGRVAPTSPAWSSSRKPLAGEFSWQGRSVFVIANHFASKGGDDPLFGRFQPPNRSSEDQRHLQAQVLRGFVDDLLAADPEARVVVAGDINDFEFSETTDILVGDGTEALTDLPRTLPQDERYTYVFDGNSQVLDHILVSPALAAEVTDYDVVHTNAEFAEQVSDHDPQVAELEVDAPEPTTLSLSADRDAVTFRDEVTLSGVLDDGTAEAGGGRRIVIEAETAVGSTEAARTTTSSDGSYAVTVTPRENTVYTARYGGGSDLPSSSEPVEVQVSPVVRAFASDRRIRRGESVQVAGVVAPRFAVEQVRLQLSRPRGGWMLVDRAPVGRDGEYAARWTPDQQQRRGDHALRVVTQPTARHAAGVSDEMPLRIR